MVERTDSRTDSRTDDERRSARGLIGFYASCTVFGIAITITAVAWIAFPDLDASGPLGWFGLVVGALAAVATWFFLGVTRSER